MLRALKSFGAFWYDFVIGDDGEVRVRAGDVDVRDLRGLLHKPGRRAVTLDQMDEAIARARAHHP